MKKGLVGPEYVGKPLNDETQILRYGNSEYQGKQFSTYLMGCECVAVVKCIVRAWKLRFEQ
jgi:hypothetical protein